MRRWVLTWCKAAPELERIRNQEIRSADTALAIQQIFGSHYRPEDPPRTSSELVEQEAWFVKMIERLRQ